MRQLHERQANGPAGGSAAGATVLAAQTMIVKDFYDYRDKKSSRS